MLRRIQPRSLVEEDGPFRYTYIALMTVPGVRLPEDSHGEMSVWTFPELNAKAVLTEDWDRYCVHMDRSGAIGFLLLTAFSGRGRFRRLVKYWNKLRVKVLGQATAVTRDLFKQAEIEKDDRHREHQSSGCYLIYTAQGELLEPVNLTVAKRCGEIGFGFDLFDGESYRKRHRNALHCTATAVALSLAETNSSPEIHFSRDLVYLTGADGLVVYSKSMTMGGAGFVTSSIRGKETIEVVNEYIPAMMGDRQIEAAIDLFVQSQRKENDNLRAFIAGWSALELLVNRFSKSFRKEWEGSLQQGDVPEWDTDLSGVPVEEYRLRDRFFSVACVLDRQSAKEDSVRFAEANSIRGEFYHRLKASEEELPTTDVRELFRKYLRLGVTYGGADSE